jgi:hypothetical protein
MRSKWDNKERKIEYAILIKRVYDKHNFIAKCHMKKAKERNDSVMFPKEEGTKLFQRRLKSYFGEEFNIFPGSYDPFASISYFNPNFNPFPVEKLKVFFDNIENMFPEPFEDEEYVEQVMSKKDILKYKKYPIFAK